MAQTPAEKQKAYRERKKEEERLAQESSAPYLKKLFSELWEENAGFSDFEMSLELAGIEPPTFEDERDPADVTRNAEAIGLEDYGIESIYGKRKGAIGRAEVTIDCLIDAAVELATLVNAYKKNEIMNRLAELEQSDKVNMATAVQEATRLNKMLELLDKQVRRNFPQWEVKGA